MARESKVSMKGFSETYGSDPCDWNSSGREDISFGKHCFKSGETFFYLLVQMDKILTEKKFSEPALVLADLSVSLMGPATDCASAIESKLIWYCGVEHGMLGFSKIVIEIAISQPITHTSLPRPLRQ